MRSKKYHKKKQKQKLEESSQPRECHTVSVTWASKRFFSPSTGRLSSSVSWAFSCIS